MKFYAQIIDKKVVQVTSADDDFIKSQPGKWVAADESTGVGDEYTGGGFRRPQPFPSWDWVKGAWVPPIAMPQDGDSHVWDEASKKWLTVSYRALAIEQSWERIKAERDRRQQNGGVNVGGKWFLSNDKEQGRYNSLLSLGAKLEVPGTYVLRAKWRTMQVGVTEDMTTNLAGSILAAGFTQFAAIDDAALAHKAAMKESEDPLTYEFSSGWPAVYGE